MAAGLPEASDAPGRSEGARIGDIVATIVLIVASLVVATGLFLGSLIWALDSAPNPVGFALGAYGPPILAILGVVLGIVAMVRRRLAFVYPLAAIVAGLLAWWIGAALVGS